MNKASVFFAIFFFSSFTQLGAYGIENAKLIQIPNDCKKNIFAPNSAEKCWVAVICDKEFVPDHKVYFTYHCPKTKKLYMTKKPGPKFTRISSALLTSKGFYYTPTHDKNGAKKSTLVFIDPASMTEEIKIKALDGTMLYFNSELKLLELKAETCSKSTLKLHDACYSHKSLEGIIDQ